MLLNEKKYGVKLSVIDNHDYEDFRRICDAIIALGYKGTVVDNGNIVFEPVAK